MTKFKTLNLFKYDGFETGWNVFMIDPNTGEAYYDHIGPSAPSEDEVLNSPGSFVCTLYGHIPGKGMEALADFATEDEADDFMEIVQWLRWNLYKTPFDFADTP